MKLNLEYLLEKRMQKMINKFKDTSTYENYQKLDILVNARYDLNENRDTYREHRLV